MKGFLAFFFGVAVGVGVVGVVVTASPFVWLFLLISVVGMMLTFWEEDA